MRISDWSSDVCSSDLVAITDMPQMVALFNGMGGGSAAAIGAVELLRFSGVGAAPSMTTLVLGVLGALIGSVSLSGSVIAWAKLDGRMDKRYTFPGQQLFNRSEEHTSELQSLMR